MNASLRRYDILKLNFILLFASIFYCYYAYLLLPDRLGRSAVAGIGYFIWSHPRFTFQDGSTG